MVASERALAATRYHRLISSDVAAINLAEGKIKVRDETGQTGCICVTYRVSKTLDYSPPHSLSLHLLLRSPDEERGVEGYDRLRSEQCVTNWREKAAERVGSSAREARRASERSFFISQAPERRFHIRAAVSTRNKHTVHTRLDSFGFRSRRGNAACLGRSRRYRKPRRILSSSVSFPI